MSRYSQGVTYSSYKFGSPKIKARGGLPTPKAAGSVVRKSRTAQM